MRSALRRQAVSRASVTLKCAPRPVRLWRSVNRITSIVVKPQECARGCRIISQASSGDEADWDAEMNIFQKRLSRPNQLATLRELEGRVNIGKVRAPDHTQWTAGYALVVKDCGCAS